MSELRNKDSCVVETANSVFTMFYHVFGSFPVSADIYISAKYKVYFACYIQIHKLCLRVITLV